jgi:hypothetical protein
LHDAADALDYMSEHFSLQHLDVKPENLLLIGGRIKVADFGLIKDLQELSASVMGGFTPIYAPPEAFDGRASRRSDQYSLAIVYQEMLTGVLPFPGKTAAQLTAQHLNSKPMLSPSPAHDRPILERALSKDPEQRFASCRELVERLARAPDASSDDDSPNSVRADDDLQDSSVDTAPPDGRATEPATKRPAADSRVTQPRPSGLSPGPPRDSSLQTDRLRTQVAAGTKRLSAPAPTKRAPLKPLPPVVDLPPVDLSEAKASLRPTLFLGVGGTAAMTLGHLRQRLNDRFGNLAAVPAVRMLLLDTDLKALDRATHGDGPTRLETRETLALPLRRPQDYRGDSKRFLRWMSRRWLYNIPRSLQTEGLRPLGRLALADHLAEVFERLRDELAALTDPQATAASSEATGLPLRTASPRVYVIASISGGTGSGMALDLAYAVRQTLRSLGGPSEDVSLLLVHSTAPMQGAKVIADANAFACLNEWEHYQHAGGQYPGDPTCGLEPAAGDAALFPASYLVHLGEDLGDAEFHAATESLAEFLDRDTATAGGAFFDHCRKAARASGPTKPTETALRTFGIWHSGGKRQRILAEETDALCLRLLRQWTNGTGEQAQRPTSGDCKTPAGTGSDAFERIADEHATQLGLHVDGLIERIDQAVSNGAPTPAAQDSAASSDFEGVLNRCAPRLAREMAESVRRAIQQWADSPDARVGGAIRASNRLHAHLKDLRAQVAARRNTLQVELEDLENALRDGTPPGRRSASFLKGAASKGAANRTRKGLLHKRQCHLRQVAVLTAAGDLVRSVTGSVLALGEQLQDTQRELDRVAQGFAPPASAVEEEDGDGRHRAEGLFGALQSEIAGRLPELLDQLDQRFRSEFLAPRGGLFAVATSSTELRRTWPTALRTTAHQVLREALQNFDTARVLLEVHREPDELQEQLRRHLAGAAAGWMSCARARRLLVVLPEGPSGQQLLKVVADDLGKQPSVLKEPTGQVAFCYEAEGVSLSHVAAQLTEGHSDCAAIARRVHTRSDVDWLSQEEEA